MPAVLAPVESHQLLDRLGEIRQRLRSAALCRGVAALGALVVGTTVLVGLVDWRWHLSDFTRAAALVGLGTAAGLTLLHLLVRPLRRRLTDLELALLVEARYPTLNDALASTVEFLKPPADYDGVSATLRRATVERASWQAHHCDFRSVARTGGVWWAAAGFLVAVIPATALFVATPEKAAAAIVRLADPFGAHAWPPQTRLTIQKPAEAAIRTASGQPFEIKATLEGVVPDQVRMLLWLDGDDPLERPCPVTSVEGSSGCLEFVLDPSDIPRSFQYRLLVNDADSGWRSVEMVAPPGLALLNGRPSPQVHLEFPAYTEMTPRDLPDGGRVIKAIVGTTVHLRAAVDRPIAQARFVYQPRNPDSADAAVVAPLASAQVWHVPGALLAAAALTESAVGRRSADGLEFAMTFVPRLSGTYSLRLVDETGIGSASEFDIHVLPDPTPQVVLERPSPARDVLAVLPTGTISIAARAEDQMEEVTGAMRWFRVEYYVRPSGVAPSPGDPVSSWPLFEHSNATALAAAAVRALGGLPANLRAPRPATLNCSGRIRVSQLLRPDGLSPRPGDTVILTAAAADFDDFTWSKAPGRSETVVIRVVEAVDLEARLQEGQAKLRQELLRIQQWQREASQKTTESQRQLQTDGRLRREDVERLFSAEQFQQRIRERVGVAPAGLQGDTARMLEMLRDNPLPPSPTQARLEAAAKDLEELGRELEPIDNLLGEARREDEALAGAVEPRPRRSAPLADAVQKQKEAEKTIARLLENLEPWSGANEVRGEVRALLEQQRQLERQTAELQRQMLGATGRPTREQQAELDRAAESQGRLAEFVAELRQKLTRLAQERGEQARQRESLAVAIEAESRRLATAAEEVEKNANAADIRGKPEGARLRLQAQSMLELSQSARSRANDLRDQARALREERDSLAQGLAADKTRPPDPNEPGVPSGEQLAKTAGQIRQNQLGNATEGQRLGGDALERVAAALDEKTRTADGPEQQARIAERKVADLLRKQEEIERQAENARESVDALKTELEHRIEMARQRRDAQVAGAELIDDSKQREEALSRVDRETGTELKQQERDAQEELHSAEQEKAEELKRLAAAQRELEKQARDLAERLSRRKAPAGKSVDGAAEQMSRAAGRMEGGEAAEAEQDDALDELDQAKRELDRQREQESQGELLREQRVKLIERIRSLKERQAAAVAELVRIHEALKKSATFSDELTDSLSALSDAEERLRGELTGLAKDRFEGVPVFADFLNQAAKCLNDAEQQIDQRKKDRPGPTEPLTAEDRSAQDAAQKAILRPADAALRRLTQLLDAVKEDPSDRKAAASQPPAAGGGGPTPGAPGAGGGDGIPPQAQLRALRSLQAEIKERTEAIAAEQPDPGRRTEEAEAELKELREAEARILDLIREFSVPDGPTRPMPNGGQP